MGRENIREFCDIFILFNKTKDLFFIFITLDRRPKQWLRRCDILKYKRVLVKKINRMGKLILLKFMLNTKFEKYTCFVLGCSYDLICKMTWVIGLKIPFENTF